MDTPLDPPFDLRDEFALAALTGCLSGYTRGILDVRDMAVVAGQAYGLADAMLAHRRPSATIHKFTSRSSS